jgi:hypothetical protein
MNNNKTFKYYLPLVCSQDTVKNYLIKCFCTLICSWSRPTFTLFRKLAEKRYSLLLVEFADLISILIAPFDDLGVFPGVRYTL